MKTGTLKGSRFFFEAFLQNTMCQNNFHFSRNLAECFVHLIRLKLSEVNIQFITCFQQKLLF